MFTEFELKILVEKSCTVDQVLLEQYLTDKPKLSSLIASEPKLRKFVDLFGTQDLFKLDKQLQSDKDYLLKFQEEIFKTNKLERNSEKHWVDILEQFIAFVANGSQLSHDEIIDRERENNHKYPFEEIYNLFIAFARKALLLKLPLYSKYLSPQSQQLLEQQLCTRLSSICSRTLLFEFSFFRDSNSSAFGRLFYDIGLEASNKLYLQFIHYLKNGGLKRIFLEYPVLARLASNTVIYWIDTTSEFLLRLEQDWQDIESTFNSGKKLTKILSLKLGLSDPHRHGRSVIQIEFQYGLKLIYKPREITVEAKFFDFLDWCNKNQLPLAVKTIKTIPRNGYGWVEYVEHKSCSDENEVSRYYFRIGILLFILTLLKGTDFHNENIISCGEHPVIIDLEMLFNNTLWGHIYQKEQTIEAKLDPWQEDSPLWTGLLPHTIFGPQGQAFDVSGIGGEGENPTGFRKFQWNYINTDKMTLTIVESITSKNENNVMLFGTKKNASQYTQEIIEGYTAMFAWLKTYRHELLHAGSPLFEFVNLEVRAVLRPTHFYYKVLSYLSAPELLKNNKIRAIIFYLLAAPLTALDLKEEVLPTLFGEIIALDRMDIPFISANVSSRNIIFDSGIVIHNSLNQSGFESVCERVRKFDRDTLEKHLAIIQWSLKTKDIDNIADKIISYNAKQRINNGNQLLNEDLTYAAKLIGEELVRRAIRTNVSSGWLAPVLMPNSNQFQLQPTDYSLYAGSAGIAVFLAALEKQVGGGEFGSIAVETLKPILTLLKNKSFQQFNLNIGISGATGSLSIAYAMLHMGDWLREPMLLDAAMQITEYITESQIHLTPGVDIVQGLASAILSFLALFERTQDKKLLAKAILCGDILIKRMSVTPYGIRSWRTLSKRYLTGFAHGAAGIAFALSSLYGKTQQMRFLEAAMEGINYERRVFNSQKKNWPDYRLDSKQSQFNQYSWCQGAPGIGLARLAGIKYKYCQEIMQEVEIALETTIKAPFSEIDQLCCGNLGRSEFFLFAASEMQQPQLYTQAISLTTQVLMRADTLNSFGFGIKKSYYNPCFFQGMAGIGYHFLRLATPNELPSLLLWK